MRKLSGTFVCVACQSRKNPCLWDGSELCEDPGRPKWTCGDLFCAANVRRISEKSRLKYLADKSIEIIFEMNLLNSEVVTLLKHYPGASRVQQLTHYFVKVYKIPLEHPLSRLLLAKEAWMESRISELVL
ncbi:MAG: hypothetical protein G01um101429_334 [Parcubacteria group bacterium Gr01-1014_29]|nr:MAG: hypothetical protein G01um101429_334 [Parcubacteria group bacterium Gr01-1014_29]